MADFSEAEKKIFDKVQSVIADQLEIETSRITLEASLRDDLECDSLDSFELIYSLQQELDVTIPDDKAVEFKTVKDLMDFIIATKKEKGEL